MADAVVNVYVTDDSISKTPIEGASLALLSPTTYGAVASAESDDAGMASFLVPAGEYELRAFKLGVLFRNPWRVLVLGTEPNLYDISGTLLGAHGVPSDTRLCRCVGRFVGHQNEPVQGALVRIVAEMDLLTKSPKVVDGNMVAPTSLEMHTDKNGYIVVDLIRGARLWFMFAGEEDQLWNFQVPDRPTANLIDLVHPAPVSVIFNPPVLNLKVGDAVLVDIETIFTDFQGHDDKFMNIFELTNSDSLVAMVAYQPETKKLAVTAVAEGTTSVSVGLIDDLYPTRIPSYTVGAVPLVVNVTP
jgi:hypothetical protein